MCGKYSSPEYDYTDDGVNTGESRLTIALTSGEDVGADFFVKKKVRKKMARLQLPQNNLDAIKQDYMDKHASAGGAVLVCRKYDRPRMVDGKPLLDKAGNPIMKRDWYEGKDLTTNESEYVRKSHYPSEKNHNDCYATLNHFPTEYTPEIFKSMHKGQDEKYRSADNVEYLTGYYLDFDHRAIHSLAKNQQATELVQDALGYADQIVATLADYLPSDFGMPVISYTGGGYGFYFRLKPLEATEENKAQYMAVWEQLYQRFSLLFGEILDAFENDHAVLDFSRVIRITGTYNDKTGAFARYIARYGNAATNEVYMYKLDEIVDLYHLDDIKEEPNSCLVTTFPLPKEKREKREKKENEPKESNGLGPALVPCVDLSSQSSYARKGNVAYPTKWYQGFANAKQLGRYLELSTKSLEYLDSRGALQRNNALFLIACLKVEIEYAKYGHYILGEVCGKLQSDICNYILDLNNSLSAPLDDDECAGLINHALTNQYHFRRRDTIQKILNLTDAEFESLGWLDKQRKEEQGKERINALTDQDKDVVKLYLDGLSDAKIAEKLHITKRQSIRIRQRLGVTDRSVKWEDIDFEDNKRYARHTKAEAPEPTPIYPYMPWYTPTPKAMYAVDYRTGNMRVKNAVVERAKMLAECTGGDVRQLMEFDARMRKLWKQAAVISNKEKNAISASFEEMRKQAEERYKDEMIDKYGVEFWEEFG